MNDVLQQLVAMSRYLGDPGRTYAILGEGNTSARFDEDTFYVKASGTCLSDIGPDGFVKVSISKVIGILDEPNATDDDVTRVLKEACVDPNETRRPSVETILHAVFLQFPEIGFVGHTHPVYTNMLLCSKIAEESMAGRLFPDHVVSMGHRSVYVPYVDPGLVLAREVRRRFREYIETEGVLPKAVAMQNHGLITLGASPKAVTSCTDMAEKASRVLVGTYAIGGPEFMPTEQVARIWTRPDEKYRMPSIAGA